MQILLLEWRCLESIRWPRRESIRQPKRRYRGPACLSALSMARRWPGAENSRRCSLSGPGQSIPGGLRWPPPTEYLNSTTRQSGPSSMPTGVLIEHWKTPARSARRSFRQSFSLFGPKTIRPLRSWSDPTSRDGAHRRVGLRAPKSVANCPPTRRKINSNNSSRNPAVHQNLSLARK